MKKRKLKAQLASVEYESRHYLREMRRLTEAIEDVYVTGSQEERSWAMYVLRRGAFQMEVAVELRKAQADLVTDMNRQIFGADVPGKFLGLEAVVSGLEGGDRRYSVNL